MNNIADGESALVIFDKFMSLINFIRDDLHYGGKVFISGLLFRPVDHDVTHSVIHALNIQLRLQANYFNKFIYLPTWKPFTLNNSPPQDHVQLVYPSGRVDWVHFSVLAIYKLRQYFKQMMGFYLGDTWCDG